MAVQLVRRASMMSFMSEHLHRRLELIRQSLLHGRLPRNLDWNDTLELIGYLGQVQPHGGGGDEFAFVVGSQREFFKRPHTHELGVEEVARLRKLLKDAAAEPATPDGARARPTVVVIDHQAAQVFQDRDPARPLQEVSVEPYDPHGLHRHLLKRTHPHYQGDRVPEETSFYQEVAKTLAAANAIVLVGHATGKSSAADALVHYLRAHHPEILGRVRAVEAVDLSALSEPEVEEIAKRHMFA